MILAGEVTEKVRALRQKFSERDQNMIDVKRIREGHLEDVAPEMFSEDIPKPIIANFIDIAARDTAEMLAPLPAFNCSSSNMSSDSARRFADKRTKGVEYYIDTSNLRAQMYTAADYFVTYGIMPFMVEPNWKDRVPRITSFSPLGCYPEKDRWNRLLSFTRVLQKPVMDLVNMYPHLERFICGPNLTAESNALLEIYIYQDPYVCYMTLPERSSLVLAEAENPMGEMMICLAERPGITEIPRGQFDDVTWIQLARNRFAMMAMEAAEQSVEAPMAVPYDVQEFQVGPLATIRTNTPEKVRRVGIEMSPAAFQEGAMLQQELQNGSRYPQVRTGNLNASIITGQGVEALQGGFNSAIQAAQEIFRRTFEEVTSLCLRMDEKLWPDHEKDIRGQSDGVPYSIKWKPSRDINKDYSVDVSYGFAMGMDPNRALVALLQMRGDRLISRDFTRRQFPFGINVTEEEATIEIEELRSALLSSVAAYSQSIPVLAQQGMNPEDILTKMAYIINKRQKGVPLEVAISEAFAPEEEEMVEETPMDMLMGNGGPGGGAQSLAQMAPGGGGMPDLMTLLSGLNSGGGVTSGVNVQRRIPA